MTSRLRPVSAGILNLWHFADQTFSFADGRLVLRGANGSGKTKALELLFPLVLDGSLDPRRLDPFSSDGRRMKDNLVAAALAADTKHVIGYTWIVFGRHTGLGSGVGEGTGDVEHLTVGVGLLGGPERDTVDHWSFITPRVPGHDLQLMDAERRPLSRRALQDELGSENVFTSLDAHRRAVDARIFGLGPERFQGMIDLVLQLRKPKLSDKLDPDQVSDLLTRSLRPVDGDALDDVARGLMELDRIADELAEMQKAATALDALHRDHAVYLRTHARLRLDAAEAARAEVARVSSHIADESAAEHQARAKAEAAEAAEAVARDAQAAREGEIAGLEDSDAYRQGKSLEDRRGTVHALQQGAARARAEADRAAAAAQRALRQAAEAHRQLQQRLDAITTEGQRLRDHAPAAVGDLPLPADPFDGDGLERAVRAATVARRAALAEVRQAVAAWEEEQTRVDQAARALDLATAREHEAHQHEAGARHRVDGARTALSDALHAWQQVHPSITADDLSTLRARALDGDRDEVAGLHGALLTLVQPRQQELLREETVAAAVCRQAQADLDDLQAQRRLIASARDDAPAALPWRTAAREGRAGAPLWRLVDFAPTLDAPSRAGLEGALLASGLLDAWLTAAPIEVDPIPDESWLHPGPPADGPTLADLLVPELQDHVAPDLIHAVLRSVPLARLGEGVVAIDAAGRFRLGPLRGAHAPAHARYIGATARQAERQRRLAELDQRIDLARSVLAQATDTLRDLSACRAALNAAIITLPDSQPLGLAIDAWRVATARLEEAGRNRQQAEATHAERRRALGVVDARRRTLAAERGLPDERPGLDRVDEQLRAFDRIASTLLGHLRALPERRAQAEHDDEEARRTAGERAETLSAAERSGEAHTRAAAELKAIDETLGVDHRRVLAAIQAARQAALTLDAEALRQRARAATARQEEARHAGALPSLRDLHAARAEDAHRADDAVSVLLRPAFALILDIEPGAEALDQDRAIRQLRLAAGDAATSETWRKTVESKVHNRFEELMQALGARVRATLTVHDGLLIIDVEDGDRQPSALFARRLAANIAQQRSLMADTERDVFKDQLLGTLCTALYQRLRTARAFASRADAELQRRPLSSGVRFGLRWAARRELSRHDAAMLEVLQRDADHLGPGDLDRVRRALRDALDALRRDDPQADHRARLDQALDYRRWHRFVLAVHRPGVAAAELTRQKHGQLSGGEKAAALYAPLFAAAQAVFAGGHATAPHLVALDEAFEGIDERGRPELLGITVAFDLDLLLTGHDLWLTDASVPAAMHAQLFHDEAQRLVVVDHIRWDGQTLEEVSSPLTVVEGTR